MKKINATKFIEALEELIENNEQTIDIDMDGDKACLHEIDTIENIIAMIKTGEYDCE